MKRKLIQMAGKTIVVSLPASWVKKYGLKKGEEIDLEEKGDSIILKTQKGQYIEKIKIDISRKSDSFAWVSIFGSYIKGADEIEILFNSNKEKKLILEICSTLIGFAIVKESNNSLVTKDVSGNATEFDSILRRIFFMLSSIGTEGLDALKSCSFKELEDLKKKDYDINYSVNFCMRYLNKKGYNTYSSTSFMYSILMGIEKLGDEYADLYRYIIFNKIKVKKEIIDLFNDVNEYFKKFHSIFFKYNENLALELVDNKNKLLTKTESLAKFSLKEEAVILSYIRSMIALIFNLTELKLISLD